MLDLEERLTEYYKTYSYRGFYKLREQELSQSGMTHLTFTNGKNEVIGAGSYEKEALKRVFDKIDKYHST